ncbi:alkaline phosphatase family protein [Tepidibacillus fermentans]|uniref:Putative AlkP superfamily pyrophosphatase or phosphodiesterase n=1 Tax=Tepidibacillus fermentans TaxID=1281767 RepID=A0A4R3KHF4_9BACI|nr:alkaline phosphatase family protein [Tepidibacillus fermentans]TCS82553.1 putative AlkP superfamily pyrophosphatase or phosphodiesterase [Tepidibacillus fermentans]
MKKIILILIDALMPEALENGIKSGKTPGLKFLMENGVYQPHCVTSFPTMTATVDSSLMTGTYSDQHKIPGLVWYDPKEKRIINYVNGAKTVLALGIRKAAKDVLYHLNQVHLNSKTKTIYEELADHGKTSGAVNFIIHRGRTVHTLKLPFLLNLITRFSLQNKKIKAADILSIGALHKPRFPGRKIFWNWNQSVFSHFGINDNYTTEVVKFIIESGHQPDFLMVYLPDHDHYLHKHIDQPLPSLEKVDQKIVQILNLFGTWEQALKQNTFIIIGDHGQTKIGKTQNHNIDLDQILAQFQVVKLGKKVHPNDQLVIGNNERMVYLYPLKKEIEKDLLNVLLQDERIDFIARKEEETVIVENHKGLKLRFAKNGAYQDPYDVNWHVHGDLAVLDVRLDGNTIEFGDYPDAFSRLYGSLFSQDIQMLVLSAKPSYEFITKTFPVHLGGGSHGSLHKTDSIVPLLVAGAKKWPKPNTRIVDLKQYILDLLEVPTT